MAGGLVYSLERQFGHDCLRRNIITPIYLTCFCEEDDLLSPWRAYGQSGRYSVDFRVLLGGIVNDVNRTRPGMGQRLLRELQLEDER